MSAKHGLKSWLVTTMSENAAVDRLNALVSKLVAAIRPPPNVSVSEWATQNRVLSPEASAEQGRWRNSRTPYLVEIMDALPLPKLRANTARWIKSTSSAIDRTDELSERISKERRMKCFKVSRL